MAIEVLVRTMGEPTGLRTFCSPVDHKAEALLLACGEQMTMGLPPFSGFVTTMGFFLPTTGEQMTMGRCFSAKGETTTMAPFFSSKIVTFSTAI